MSFAQEKKMFFFKFFAIYKMILNIFKSEKKKKKLKDLQP